MNLDINSWINFKAQYANNEDFNARKMYWYKMWFVNPAHNDTETQRF